MKWISLDSKKRLFIILLGFLLYSVFLLIRLLNVQVFQNEELTEKAKVNWDREIPFANERGVITDRNGEMLVINKLAPTLYFMPSQNKNVTEAAKAISTVLRVKEETLLEKMNKRTYLVKLAPEAKNISYDDAVKVQNLQIDGLYTGVDYTRAYPYGTLLSRVLGFTGYDMQGLAGIEYAYDDILSGKNSAIRLYTDAKGQSLDHVDDGWRSGKDGATLELTIDVKVQEVMEREMSQAMVKHNADQALALAMDPNTGEILGISSYPTFHPADYKKVGQEIYNRNLPVWMSFEPGSTFKIITLSAALEEGVVNLKNEHFFDPGYSIVEGTRLRCWKRQGHGDQTFLQVVENSCNPGFIELGQRVGTDKLMEYIKKFGFGQKTGSNIAGEATGILFSKEAFGPVEHATTSFGQGVSVTPIQQVQAVSAAINGGKLFTPYIVKRILDSQTNTVLQETQPMLKRQVVSENTSKQVREALESVVANGSGRQAFRDGLRIGGKTGTAQKVENNRYKDGEYIVSFIGFAPANDPKIVVYVAIDNPKGSLQFGGTIAAPIVGQIIEDIHPYLNIKKSTDQLERAYRWGDTPTARVPDLTGLKSDEVSKMEYPFRLQWHGEGNMIRSQMPTANTLVPEDGIIHVYLSNDSQ